MAHHYYLIEDFDELTYHKLDVVHTHMVNVEKQKKQQKIKAEMEYRELIGNRKALDTVMEVDEEKNDIYTVEDRVLNILANDQPKEKDVEYDGCHIDNIFTSLIDIDRNEVRYDYFYIYCIYYVINVQNYNCI